MSNIEEDIKILKQFNSLKINSYAFKFVDISYPKLQQAIDNILVEREQDKKRIKELEEENRIYALNGSNIELEMHIKNNYIPKQKVKDLIENETINISGFECIAVEDLEELLEEK